MNMNIAEEKTRHEEQVKQLATNIVQLNAIAMLDEPEKFVGRSGTPNDDNHVPAKEPDFTACVLQTETEVNEFVTALYEDNEKLMRRLNGKDEALRNAMLNLEQANTVPVGELAPTFDAIKRGLAR